jgi:hypothetical protein
MMTSSVKARDMVDPPSYRIGLDSNPTSEQQDDKSPTAAGEIVLAAVRLAQYSNEHEDHKYDENGFYHEFFSFHRFTLRAELSEVVYMLSHFECEHSIHPVEQKRNHLDLMLFVVNATNALSSKMRQHVRSGNSVKPQDWTCLNRQPSLHEYALGV